MNISLKNANVRKKIKELVIIAIGCAMYAFALMTFNVPNELAEGGASGISLLLYYAFGLPVSWGSVVVNIPLLIIGSRVLSKRTMWYTIYGIIILTLWIKFFELFPVSIDIKGDKLLAAVFGGVIGGTGLGVVFAAGGTTGGTDIIAKMIQVWTGISIGRILQVLDAIILCFSFMVLRSYPSILYTLIYVYISTKVIDLVAEGGVPGKGVMIVSPKLKEITEKVTVDMERGLTYLKGQGSYSGKDMNIGYCVVSRNEIGTLKSIVYDIDPKAFVTITEVHDIMGEGFSFDQPKKVKFGKKDK